jgi:hypothetical protein
LDMYKKMCGIRANIIESRQQEIKDQARVEQQKLKKKKHSKMQSKTSFYLFLQQSLFIFCSYLVFTS